MAVAIDTAPQEKVKTLVQQQSDDFTAFSKTKTDSLQEDVGKIVDKYSDPETYKTITDDIITQAWTTITTAYATLSTTVANVLVSITNQLTAVATVFTGTGSGIAGQLAQINNLNDVINLVNWVISNVEFMVNMIAGLVDEIIEAVNFVVNTAVNVGTKLLQDAGDAITTAITDVIEAPVAVVDKHLQKVTAKANEMIATTTDRETLVELTTGRKPGEQDFITSIEAFGGKLTEDQDKHGIKIPKPTDVDVLIGA